MENIKLDDFTRFKFLSDLKYSPDGRHAGFVVHRMDLEDNKYLSNIWIYNVDGDGYFQLTSFDEKNGYEWLNNDTILFTGNRNPKDKKRLENGESITRLYEISIHGGEATEVLSINMKVTSVLPVREKLYLFTAQFSPYEKNLDDLSDEDKKDELKKRKEEKDYQILDEIPFVANGEGYTNKVRNRLYVYKDGDISPVTDEYTNVEVINLNNDKTMAVLCTRTYKDKMPLKNDVYLYDIDSGKLKKLNSDNELSHDYAEFIDNSSVIAVASDMKRFGVNENHKFYLYDTGSGRRTLMTPDLDMSLFDEVGSDCRYGDNVPFAVDDGYLYFTAMDRFNSNLYRTDKDGNIEKIINAAGSLDGFDVKNGNIIYIAFRDRKIDELYKQDEGSEVQITKFNEWLPNERYLQKPERLEVETKPGVTIDGWVIKPVDFDVGSKYPAILDVHGGPKTADGDIYFHEMQYWASHGYFVLFCNPRGSDGRGNEFADIRGKYGTIDYDDLMKFTDSVLEKYNNIDKNRLGVTGGSYGGFMTNWIIGHTDRFKAAASQRSISNWVSDFGTTDIGFYFNPNEVGGNPWNNIDKYWEHSPLRYADKVKTPTLFIHSDEDHRCWMGEGLQMFTALKYFGVESRLCLFHGENHELSRSGKPKHRIRRLKEITEWFDSHLK